MIICFVVVVAICLYLFASYVADFFTYGYCGLFYDDIIECKCKHCKHYKECEKNLSKREEK